MQEGQQTPETAAELLTAAADYIETHGLLERTWHTSALGRAAAERLPPCGCLIGTLRVMAGEPPGHPRPAAPPMLAEAERLLMDATPAERESVIPIPRGYAAPEDGVASIYDWSDHYADRRANYDHSRCEYLRELDELRMGDRAKVVKVLRRVAAEATHN